MTPPLSPLRVKNVFYIEKDVMYLSPNYQVSIFVGIAKSSSVNRETAKYDTSLVRPQK